MTFHQRQGVLVCMQVLLHGCSAAPALVTKTRAVEVPVAVPCRVPPIEAPAWALDQVHPAADVYSKGRAALVELEQRKAFEEKQAAAIAACQ